MATASSALLAASSAAHSLESIVAVCIVLLFVVRKARARRWSPRPPGHDGRPVVAPPPGHRHAGDPRYVVGSSYHQRSVAASQLPTFVRQAQGLDPHYDPADFYTPS